MQPELLRGGIPPERRREVAAATLKEFATDAGLAPPARDLKTIDGKEFWIYNASAISEICQWMLQASDEELDLINELNDGNALMDCTVFLHEKSSTH